LCSTNGSAYFDSDVDVDPYDVFALEESGYAYEYDGDCVDNISIDVTIDGLPEDVSIGNLEYASQVIGQVNVYNPGQLLDQFIGYSAFAAPPAAGFVGAANAFAAGAGVGYVLGTGANAAAGISSWVDVGSIFGYKFLSMSDEAWEALGTEGQQAAMAGFIQDGINLQAPFLFTSNPALAPAGSGLQFEYSYILSQGLQVVQEGTSWVVQYPINPISGIP
jgi:hypothetical protein